MNKQEKLIFGTPLEQLEKPFRGGFRTVLYSLLALSLLGALSSYFFLSGEPKATASTSQQRITELAAKELWYDQDISSRSLLIKERARQIAEMIAQNDSDELTNQDQRGKREQVRACKYNLLQSLNPPCDPLPLLSQPSLSPGSTSTASPTP